MMQSYQLLIFSLIASAAFCQAASQPIVLVADPKVLSIQIHDNHEPLVNLKKEGGIAIGPSPEIPNNQDYFYLRKTVYEKLLAAQKLLPPGLKFRLYEGYRSLQLQKKLFDARFAKIKKLHPEWSYQQQFLETTRLVSPVVTLTGAKNRPPHSTGGAFDIYLINDKEEAVDMGIHPKDWMLDTY
ncbi:MAG: hypothetical protein ACH346_03870, partial [Chthoniobacterales bacterium]